jgi:hypothetical protein
MTRALNIKRHTFRLLFGLHTAAIVGNGKGVIRPSRKDTGQWARTT